MCVCYEIIFGLSWSYNKFSLSIAFAFALRSSGISRRVGTGTWNFSRYFAREFSFWRLFLVWLILEINFHSVINVDELLIDCMLSCANCELRDYDVILRYPRSQFPIPNMTGHVDMLLRKPSISKVLFFLSLFQLTSPSQILVSDFT